MRFLLIILLLTSLFVIGCDAEASDVSEEPIQENYGCHRGVSDDPYPGQCPQYVDNNANGECDLGESS